MTRTFRAVLIDEDDADLLKLLTRMVAHLGYQPVPVSSPSEALELVQDFCNPITVMLTDIDLPVMDGFLLARQMHRHRPDLKVVFMSGKHHPEDLGVTVLQKPFNLTQLEQALQR